MAVTYNDNYYKAELAGTTHHVGLVVEKTSSCERIMSDVWATCYYAHIWDVEEGKPKVIGYGNDEFGSSCTVVVDATDDIKVAYELYKVAVQAKAQALKAAQQVQKNLQEAQEEWDAPEKGKVMQVVRGRKVPKGTVGKVFWLDDPCRPYRAGLAVSDEVDERGRHTDIVWVNAEYLKNVDEFPGYARFLELQDAKYAAIRAAQEARRAS
jgi:hypothetical protein